jgi:peptide/nickel transport system substrate-binding protein
VALSVAAALGFTAACNSGTGTNEPTKPQGAGFNAAADKIINPSDKKGGTLKLVNSSDADSWDPVRGYYAFVWNLNRLYTRKLVDYARAVGKDGLVLTPDLATALPEISADGKTYKFTLKDGIKFEDGSPITSKDIKYGIERVWAQDVVPGGPYYLPGFLDNGQNYPGPYKDKDPNKLGLKSVETPDDKTIIFHLSQAFGDFIYLLAMPGSGPVPQAKDTGDKYGLKPVSSGPYKFESYEPGKSVVWVRNDNWDQATDTIRTALPDKIEMTLGLDPNEIDNRLLDGSADVDTGQTGVQAAAQAKILQDESLKANADAPFNGFIRYFAIDQKVAPFDNADCRKAVIYATDKVALQTARGGPIAGGDIATDMIPPNVLGHDDAIDPLGTKQGKPQIDKAKAALAACGKPNGFDTVIAVREKGKEPATAEALKQALSAVGIKATIETHSADVYYKSVVGSPDNVHKKGYGIIFSGWGADWPAPYGFLQVLVDGRFILKNGNNNFAEINDPTINQMIDQSLAEPDPVKNGEIWKQINAKVMDTNGLVPFVYDKALNYRNPRLSNIYIHDAFGMVDFQALGVAG